MKEKALKIRIPRLTVLSWLVACMLTVSACNELGSNTDSSASGSENSLSITGIGPFQRACDIPVNRSLMVTFSDSMDTSSLTATTTGDDCSGTFQVSNNDFNTCVRMSGFPEASNSGRSFVFTPAEALDASTDYDIKITGDAKSADNQTLSSNFISAECFTSGAEMDQTAPQVTAVTPYSLYERIPVNTRFVITFNEPMRIPTLSTTTEGSSCTGSVQLSKSGFTNCVTMVRDPEPSANHQSFTITPAEDLETNRLYRLKITTDVSDSSGNPLASDFIISRGLTTGAERDESAPTVTNIFPTNGLANVSVLEPIIVRFSERMDPASIQANISGTSCSNTVRVSTDDFASCVRMTSEIEVINAGRSFAFNPASELPEGTHYQIRVAVGATDLAGNPLVTETFYLGGYTTTQSPFDFSSWDLDFWVE